MTGRATSPRSRTTLTGTWLLAVLLVLAPALSDVCAAMCAMPMPAPMRMPASDSAATGHHEHQAGTMHAATHHDAAAHRSVAAHHDHCGAASTTASTAASATGVASGPAAPFALRAAHHCVLHGSTAPSSADETRAVAARGGAAEDGRRALAAPPAVAALTFALTAPARYAPLLSFGSTSGLASARPLRVPLRI
jgi:hypothetical protein